jgi:hypothetical protein
MTEYWTLISNKGNTLKKGEFYYSNSNPISDFFVSLLIRQSSDLLYLLNEDLQLQQKNGCAHESILCYGWVAGVKLTIVFKPSRSVNVKEVELPSDREIGDD